MEIKDFKSIEVSFKIGSTQMYVLSDISGLYNAYQNEEEIRLGKKLKFIPKFENFSEESRDFFKFILNYEDAVKISADNDRYSFRNSFSNKLIVLSSKRIDDFFEIAKGRKLIVSILKKQEEFYLTDEPLEISCSLKREIVKSQKTNYWYEGEDEQQPTEELVLKLNISNYYVVQSEKYLYIFYKNKIYKEEINEDFIALFNLFQLSNKALIPEDRIDEFMRFVVPNIKFIKNMDLPAEIKNEAIIVDKLATKMLLDSDDNGNILMELKFCYGNKEFNILELHDKLIKDENIVRNVPEEAKIIERIFMDGFKLIPEKKHFILQNPDDMYDFLFQKIDGYMKDFEVLVTDKFKNREIKQPKISNIGVKIDNGLLKIDISKLNIDFSEINDILSNYKIKRKYYKLKNGDIINLTNSEDLNLLDEMMTTMDIDYSKLDNGIINLPVNRSIYLEKLLENNKDISINKNNEFVELVNNIDTLNNTEKSELDEEFENILREYQKIGYRWMKNLDTYKFGGILADDMGLRKNFTNNSIIEVRN